MVTCFEQQHGLARHQMILMHDNARPHVAGLVKNWIDNQAITLQRQAPYSPDTNLMDRYVFRNFESFRRFNDFENINQMKEAVMDFVTNRLTSEKLHRELDRLKQDIQAIIDIGGDYL